MERFETTDLTALIFQREKQGLHPFLGHAKSTARSKQGRFVSHYARLAV